MDETALPPASPSVAGPSPAAAPSGVSGDAPLRGTPSAEALPPAVAPDAAPPDVAAPDAAAPDAAVADAAVAAAPQDPLAVLLRLVEAGGPVVLVLAALSVLSLGIVLAKLWQFRAARAGDRRTPRAAVALWRAGRAAEALETARAGRDPASAVLAVAIAGRAAGTPEPALREDCHREAALRVEALRGWLRPLELTAALAPLLGLLGTVLGMIEAFARLESAGSRVDPALLSGGIWEALLTTAAGLAVAIPATAAAGWFERRIERVEHEIDTGLAGVFAAAPAPSPLRHPDRRTGHDPHRLRPAAAE